MNVFDLWIMHFVNSFAQRSWAFDATMVQISDNNLVVGGILMIMFWWAWMEYGKDNIENRKTLALSIFVTTFAVVVARAVALSLPFRARPFHTPALHFIAPFTLDPEGAIHWSSFPSDHAVVAFCIAASLRMVSASLGNWAIGYAILSNLPRIYAGVHYPTDILVGALLGVGIARLSKARSLRNLAGKALNFLEPHPRYLYPLLFFLTYEIGEMYNSVRRLAVVGARIALRYPAWEFAVPVAFLGFACGLASVLWWKRQSIASSLHLRDAHGAAGMKEFLSKRNS